MKAKTVTVIHLRIELSHRAPHDLYKHIIRGVRKTVQTLNPSAIVSGHVQRETTEYVEEVKP